MNLRKLSQRITEIVSEPNTDQLKYYLEVLRDNMKLIEDRFHRDILLVSFLIVVFELLTRAAVTEATIGPFKLKDLSLVQKLIPIITAYLYNQMISLGTLRRLLREIYDELIGKFNPAIHRNNLGPYLLPPSRFVVEDLFSVETEGTYSHTVFMVIRILATLLLILGPFLFEVYAYFICFSRFGSGSIILWSSLFISLVLIVQSFLFFGHFTDLVN